MPLERVVEFKIAVNIDLLPDLIFFVGKTGSAMFEDRPEKLPRPRDPRLFQLARRLDEILNQLTLYIQPQVVKLPYDSLDSLVREVLERLESVYKEVIYYIQLIDRLKAQLTVARELAVVKPTAMPSVEALVTYVVLWQSCERSCGTSQVFQCHCSSTEKRIHNCCGEKTSRVVKNCVRKTRR